jgi:alpha-amylase
MWVTLWLKLYKNITYALPAGNSIWRYSLTGCILTKLKRLYVVKTAFYFCGILLLMLMQSCFGNQPATAASKVMVRPLGNFNWQSAVAYEIFVQSFYDSNNDGTGDIPGMTSQLDYIKNLGANAIWLMPIMPSPSYHKYDVTDYRSIHPDYGTLNDFKVFLDEAHARGIAVIIDLVVNHTSCEHPWFQTAVSNPDSPYRNYYTWADYGTIAGNIEKKKTAPDSDNRIQWHAHENDEEYYYGYFWGGMPDLNFDNPDVRREVIEIGRFWLTEVGVDGFRLDAARHIFPDHRAEDNHQWWVEFRLAMEEVKPDVFLLGEVWDEAEVVAPYLKGLHSLFNFNLGRSLIDGLRAGTGNELASTHKHIRDYYTRIRPDFIDAIFLTNHDQQRVRSELTGPQAKVAASLLLTLPGTPFIYYGEEIGMKGNKPDEYIREPFLWEPASTDTGRTHWIKPKYNTDERTTPLSSQKRRKNSIYSHYRHLIQLRRKHAPLNNGLLEPVTTSNRSISAYWRKYGEQSFLIVHNVSDEKEEIFLDNVVLDEKEILFQSGKVNVKTSRVQMGPHSSVILEAVMGL